METFDEYFLNRFPIIQATQQRFNIFQEQLTKHIKSESVVASLPCGLMDDLLTLGLPNAFSGKLVGIDADPLSIQKAGQNAVEKNRKNICDFYVKDAWNLEQPDIYDIITSNGLNVYVDKEPRVISLYKSFFDTLKPGGILITSFVTPPPTISEASEWDMSQIDTCAVASQKEAMIELIGVNWTHFYTSAQTRSHLEQVGFENIQFHWDVQKMFPTVTAVKPD
jgi:SAM-dependent methyltransferase